MEGSASLVIHVTNALVHPNFFSEVFMLNLLWTYALIIFVFITMKMLHSSIYHTIRFK